MNIYVGNLSPDVTEEDLMNLFSPFGQVKEAKVIRDMFSQDSRGFGFVEMFTKDEGMKAISGLNGTVLKDREIKVNEARPRDNNRRGGGGGGGFNRRNRY